MWRVRADRRDGSIVAESPPDDVAWLEIESETMIRLWSASFRLPIGWYERAWLHDNGWIRDRRFTGVRTVLRELESGHGKARLAAEMRQYEEERAAAAAGFS